MPARPLFVVALALLAACTGKGGDSDDGLPHIHIVSPADGSTVPTCLKVTVTVDNFEIVAPSTDTAPTSAQGVWDLVLNNNDNLMVPCEALECSLTLDGYDDGPLTVGAVLADTTYNRLTDASGGYVEDAASYTLAGDDVKCP